MTLEAAKVSIRPGMIVRFKPVWQTNSALTREGKVVAKYEHHFRVRLGKVYECFTYTDVMLGNVQIVRR